MSLSDLSAWTNLKRRTQTESHTHWMVSHWTSRVIESNRDKRWMFEPIQHKYQSNGEWGASECANVFQSKFMQKFSRLNKNTFMIVFYSFYFSNYLLLHRIARMLSLMHSIVALIECDFFCTPIASVVPFCIWSICIEKRHNNRRNTNGIHICLFSQRRSTPASDSPVVSPVIVKIGYSLEDTYVYKP